MKKLLVTTCTLGLISMIACQQQQSFPAKPKPAVYTVSEYENDAKKLETLDGQEMLRDANLSVMCHEQNACEIVEVSGTNDTQESKDAKIAALKDLITQLEAYNKKYNREFYISSDKQKPVPGPIPHATLTRHRHVIELSNQKIEELNNRQVVTPQETPTPSPTPASTTASNESSWGLAKFFSGPTPNPNRPKQTAK